MKSVREERIARFLMSILSSFKLTRLESRFYSAKLHDLKLRWTSDVESERSNLILQMDKNRDRMARLTDALIDQTIEKDIFAERKADLLRARVKIQERLETLEEDTLSLPQRVTEFFELADKALLMYEMGLAEERRDLLKLMTSNRLVKPNEVAVEPSIPFSYLANSASVSKGGGSRDRLRTCEETLTKVMDWCKENPKHEMWEKIHELLERSRRKGRQHNIDRLIL
jgi:hypothetical protein